MHLQPASLPRFRKAVGLVAASPANDRVRLFHDGVMSMYPGINPNTPPDIGRPLGVVSALLDDDWDEPYLAGTPGPMSGRRGMYVRPYRLPDGTLRDLMETLSDTTTEPAVDDGSFGLSTYRSNMSAGLYSVPALDRLTTGDVVAWAMALLDFNTVVSPYLSPAGIDALLAAADSGADLSLVDKATAIASAWYLGR